MSNFLDGKLSRDVVYCPASCHLKSKLCTFAFRSCEVLRFFSEIDPHSGVDKLGFFLLFFRKLAFVFAP